ncbi:MAG TPA: SDR family oxidoreductase [Thermoanaerobaculaceae bacterium]|nr:SDR family oxidoreductase [Thermoanaerobaculaceae bacterium]HRS16273.1 SDR family oxidoreductase [Thermoanaerobaculaceae bacterium]
MIGRILVTGASRGIGRAIALRLAAPGRELVLHGRDEAALAAVAAEAARRGAHVRTVAADLCAPDGVRRTAEAAGEEPLGALVHNAGRAIVKPVGEITPEEWRHSLELGVTAPFLLTQALLPRLAAGSAIVHVLSVAARQGFPGWGAYCAAKFALEGFSQCLRAELRGRGVRVVNVYPSATASELWDAVPGTWPRERMLAPGEVAEAVAYALDRPPDVLVEEVAVGHLSGTL